MRENIIISDLHGCIDEFNEFLEIIKYNPNKQRLILVGDILSRGKDPVGLLRQVQDMNLECVLSNHEKKALDWRNFEVRAKITGIENTIEPPNKRRQEEWEELNNNDLKWISNLPVKIHIKENWYAVHAGMEPSKAFHEQVDDTVIRIRYVNKNGEYSKTKTDIFWAQAWNQPYNIVFGHSVVDEPVKFKNKNNICVGIDLGCVYGGYLCGYNVDRDEFIRIKAKKVYYKK